MLMQRLVGFASVVLGVICCSAVSNAPTVAEADGGGALLFIIIGFIMLISKQKILKIGD